VFIRTSVSYVSIRKNLFSESFKLRKGRKLLLGCSLYLRASLAAQNQASNLRLTNVPPEVSASQERLLSRLPKEATPAPPRPL
jgi:hypothetical protein